MQENDFKKYPLVFKFVAILFLLIDILLFFYASLTAKFYCIVLFVVFINFLITSEGEHCEYNDLFIIVDSLTFIFLALMLLTIYEETLLWFWLLSALVQWSFVIWSQIFKVTNKLSQADKKTINNYSVLDSILGCVSIIIFILGVCLKKSHETWFMIGFIPWLITFFFWWKDKFTFHSGLILPQKRILLYDVKTGSFNLIAKMKVNGDGRISNLKLKPVCDPDDIDVDYYMLPGLIDTNIHLQKDLNQTYSSNDFIKENLEDVYEQIKKNVSNAMKSGITTICAIGGNFFESYGLVKKIREEFFAPRIVTVSCFFSKQYSADMRHGEFIIKDKRDALIYADYLSKFDDIKFIKFVLGGYEFDTNIPSIYTEEELLDIVSIFKNKNFNVIIRAQREEDIKTAIDIGVEFIECNGCFSNSLIELIKSKNTYLTLPLCVIEDIAIANMNQLNSSIETTENAIWKTYGEVKETLFKLYEKNTKVALGSDNNLSDIFYPPLIREIISLVNDAHIDKNEVLKSATLIAAKKIGKENDFGYIADNFFADFVLYDENFIKNISALSRPNQVWIKGNKVFDRIEEI